MATSVKLLMRFNWSKMHSKNSLKRIVMPLHSRKIASRFRSSLRSLRATRKAWQNVSKKGLIRMSLTKKRPKSSSVELRGKWTTKKRMS